MKTIEEAAEEFCETRLTDGRGYPPKVWFKSGVEFAQRWIPVEEELPNENITVIAKCGIVFWISAMKKGRLIGYQVSMTGYKESFEATHWRPIELS